MSWPHATDYNAAVQNPQLCFSDDDLRQGQAVGDLFGLPRPHSGNFADVYQIQSADGQSWAVKCFTRPVEGLRPRYHGISEHLRQTQRAFMVEFHFLDEGIRIHGQWHPLVKMRWVEGFRLNEFVREQLNKPVLLERLAQMWIRLGQELRDAGMAHGDLQHGNVLLVPGSKSSSLALKLIDYDGMFVPALADLPSGEVGHPNYQHPQRLREGGYNRDMDRFAHLLIYTALRSLRLGGAELWQRHDSGENLLFREEDFRQPSKSRLLRELWDMKDRDIRYLVGHLLLTSRGSLDATPALDELVDDSGIRPLSDREEAKINAFFEGETAPRRSRLVAATVGPAFQPDSLAGRAGKPDLRESVTVQTAALTETQPIELKSVPPPLPPDLTRPRRRTSAEIDLDTHPPDADKPRDAAPLVEPLVSILSRPAWLAALGAIVLLSFLVLNVLVWSSVKQPVTTAAVVRPPVLKPIEDVLLREGYKSAIHFHVDRRDCRDPLTLRIDGVPDDLKAPEDRRVSTLSLAQGADSCSLRVLAPLGVGPPRRNVRVSLWDGGEKKDEQTFHLSVQAIARPALPPPDNIACRAGQSPTFSFPVRRNACREPLFITLEGLPLSIQQENPPSTDADTLSVKLTVAKDLTPQAIPLKLSLHVGDVIADNKTLVLNVQADSPKLTTAAPPRVRLNAKTADSLTVDTGQAGELRVLLDRGENRSEVEVSLLGLPAGVAAEPVTIPPALSLAHVNVETALDAEPGDYDVKLRVRAGEQTVAERAIALHVRRSRGRQEVVRIHTIDHLNLTGTLYHGWKGKQGMTVLMLHDLGRHRATPAWKHLAETLQAEGHTVLTFDFRGHGDSHTVERAFWDYPVNRLMLPNYVRDKPLDDHPSELIWTGLPSEYLPWLIHDIAAARMYLDLRHDEHDSPVNTFNLVVFGAGHGAALGSLWLASEGVRINGLDRPNGRIILKPPEKLSVLQTVWLGMESRWKMRAFPVRNWIRWAHLKPTVPITFVYGGEDADTYRFLQQPMRDGEGKGQTLPNAASSSQRLLDKDAAAERWMEEYLVKTLKPLPPQNWVPRQIKKLHSYWMIPVPAGLGKEKEGRFFVAKRPGEVILSPLPLEHFDIEIKGLNKQRGFLPEPGS
jgi:hypothetical protein